MSRVPAVTDSDGGPGTDPVQIVAELLDGGIRRWVETGTPCPDTTHAPRLRKIRSEYRWVCLHWATPKEKKR